MEHNAASPVKNSELVEALGDWAGAPPHVRLRAASAAASLSAASGITPDQLLATKQFKPFEDPAAPTRSDAGPAAVALLSAPEKIRELTKLLESARSERERLAREVDDVQVRRHELTSELLRRREIQLLCTCAVYSQAEKVSMEYLLREKLEKLVQSEIESRLAAYQRDGVSLSGSVDSAAAQGTSGPGSAAYASMVAASNRQLQADAAARSDELAAMRLQQTALEDEVQALRRRLQQAQADAASGNGGSDGAVAAAVAAAAAAASAEGRDPASVQLLRDRLSVHVKERRAIHTIMEQKIKTLVDAIAAAAASVQAPLSSSTGPHPGGQLSREVQALQRLVNASIAALRNSELEQQQTPDLSASATSPASAPAAPLARFSERSNTSTSAYAAPPSTATAGYAAPTPVSVDVMIQRRKDELARIRAGSDASSSHSASFHGRTSVGSAAHSGR
jgi:hypothetical protein